MELAKDSIPDFFFFILVRSISRYGLVKSNPRLTQDIAYMYEILHCNQFIILGNAIAYETTTINQCPSPVDAILDASSKPPQGWDTDRL